MIFPCGCAIHVSHDTRVAVCVHQAWRLSELPAQPRKPAPNPWDELHQYAVDYRDRWCRADAQEFYRQWLARVQQHCASCNNHWDTYTATNPPDYSSADAFFRWSVNAHNHVSVNHATPRKAPMLLADARLKYRFPRERGLVQHMITWEEFTRDTLALAQMIAERHPDVSGIAGCPRSGMRAATEVALRLGLPLYEASERHGLRPLSSGWRLRSPDFHGLPTPMSGPIVIVDDSTCSGTAINEMRKHPELSRLPVYVVYGAGVGKSLVDGYAVAKELPHWFEWNLLGNGSLLRDMRIGIDWDGVLNDDCPVDCDDDGPRYIEWLNAVRPIRWARSHTVPFIVTARREAYRSICEAWLARHRISYGQLIMFPGTFSERSRTDIGAWKAEMCNQHGVGMFIESDLRQARRIADIRQRITISIERQPA